jgi:hypothetical protein
MALIRTGGPAAAFTTEVVVAPGGAPDRLASVGSCTLHRLGGLVPLPADDGAGTGAWRPFNTYVLTHDAGALLIDPGAAIVGEAVLAQLRSVVPDDTEIAVLLTRGQEFDTLGNLGRVLDAFTVTKVMSSGISNAIDAFRTERTDIPLVRLRTGDTVPLGTLDALEIVVPRLRTLSTIWAYWRSAGVLWTSDMFGHISVADAADPVVCERPAPGWGRDDVAEWLRAKFWWLPGARTPRLTEDLLAIFAEHETAVLAPSRGCVVRGKALVDSTVRLLVSAVDQASELPIAAGRSA